MSDLNKSILYIGTLGGIGVLITYMFIYLSGTGSKLFKIISKNKIFYRIWISSTFIVVLSYLYLLYYYYFIDDFVKTKYRFYLELSLFAFLLFASLWSLIIEVIVKYKKNPRYQQPILILVALATIFILTLVALDRKDDPNINIEKNILLAAAIFIFLHHTFFDAIAWVNLHVNNKLM